VRKSSCPGCNFHANLAELARELGAVRIASHGVWTAVLVTDGNISHCRNSGIKFIAPF
jgi:hypothetical protein